MRVLPSAALLLTLSLTTACATVGEKVSPVTGVRGTVVSAATGEPVAGVYVYGYRDFSKNMIGIADYMSRPSDDDGSYMLEMPPGRYGIAARKRVSGNNYGPLSTGDLYDNRAQEGPVKVASSGYTRVDFRVQEVVEPMFFNPFPGQVTDTGVRGRILDMEGKPVPGAFVLCFTNSDMKRVPDYTSTLTGEDGSYTLFLQKGGRYYLAARVHVREVPGSGEPFGRYAGSPDHSVEVVKGRFLQAVDIELTPYSGTPPPGYRPYTPAGN